MIQGFGGGHDGWFFQIRTFKKHFRTITFDPRGIGKSGKSGESYAFKTMADDTIGLLDCLGIKKAHILGVSLGGTVAQEIAIEYPERVRKLILVSTTTGKMDIGDLDPDLQRVLGIMEDPTKIDNQSINFFRVMSKIISLSFNKRLYRALILPLTLSYIRSVGVEGYLKQLDAIAEHSTAERLHRIQCPTLVITGTEDKLVSPRFSEDLARRIPHAKLTKVAGGSHAFFMEMRHRFNQEVLDFLGKDS